MRAHSGFPLDDDVVDRIFTFSPSFASLCALASTSRATRAVFETRRASIVRAVAHNVCGPAWPVALRAVRANAEAASLSERLQAEAALRSTLGRRRSDNSQSHSPKGSQNSDTEDESDVTDGDDDDDALSDDEDSNCWVSPKVPDEVNRLTAIMSIQEFGALQRIGDDALQLERLFSQRFIDMSAPGTILGVEESTRFHRALYLHETFAVLYGRPDLTQFSRLLGSEDDRKRHEEDMLAFLANLPEHELFALQEVNLFLQHILRWLITATHDSTGLAINSVSWSMGTAAAALDCSPSVHLTHGYGWPRFGCDFISETLERVREQRKIVNHEWVPMEVRKAIATPTSNLCDHCRIYSGPRLYSSFSWQFLRGDLTRRDLQQLVPGRLWWNASFGASLRETLSERTFLSDALMNLLFDQDEEDMTGGGWSQDQHLCMDCIKTFLTEHIVSWWKRCRAAGGKPVPLDDCWYGWGCRTQTHKPAHAEKLNHLCVPTRGSG